MIRAIASSDASSFDNWSKATQMPKFALTASGLKIREACVNQRVPCRTRGSHDERRPIYDSQGRTHEVGAVLRPGAALRIPLLRRGQRKKSRILRGPRMR